MSDADPGLAARAAALDLLIAALGGRTGLDEGLTAPALKALDARDRAFARAITMAALRRLGPIDRALDARLRKAPPERVLNILRIGVAQALVMGAPPHAAVGATVELAAAHPASRSFKGLVNAILRGLLREPPPLDDPEALAPPWLYARWQAAFGQPEARAIAAMIAEEPATDLTPRYDQDAPGLAAELEAEVLPGPILRTGRRGELSVWPGFAEGRWWVQDASAAVPVRLLEVRPGETALDMCAAPGGKTLQLAAAGARVTALDKSANRLQRVSENLARIGLSAETVAADAVGWADARRFDAVLLDAPCSSTGAFRRHPDVLWAARPGDIATLAAMQSRLLDAAVERVRPGGRLVYCVCSIEPEEGEAQARGFLARHPDFALAPMSEGEAGAPPVSLRPDGALRILPHHRQGGTDGFYVARFTRAPA